MAENENENVGLRSLIGRFRRCGYGTLEDDNNIKKQRSIEFNGQQSGKTCSNKISTSKYNAVTFLPKFLLEQFSRYANVFFLLIALLQQIQNVSPTGRYTTAVPLLFVLLCSAVKEIVEDWKRHKADDQTNNRISKVIRDGKLIEVRWTEVVVGDIVKVENGQFFPADLILLSSSEPMGMCYIETANLDGETNLKLRQASPSTVGLTTVEKVCKTKGTLECEGPNNRLYNFVGNVDLNNSGSKTPLSADQILLRGAQLRNTAWVFGIVVYTGHESKLLQNATAAPIKRSNVDHMTNIQILFLFGLLLALALLSAIGNTVWTNKHEYDWYFGFSSMDSQNFGLTFLTFFILYNNLIPISLPVTLEVVKFIQAMFINWDLDMYYNENNADTPAMARTSNLNEELGQIKFIFSDKTGTLTRNIMELKKMSIDGEIYDLSELSHDPRLNIADLSDVQRQFLTALSICHTIVPEREKDKPENIIYQGASPDEEALVKGAVKMGFIFTTRTPTSVIIDVDGHDEVYEILNVLEFNSTRKRMSVVVKMPDGSIRVFCKGADNVIYDRLSEQNHLSEETLSNLKVFASDGLRTLCIAVSYISNEDYDVWNKEFYLASTALENRDERLEDVAELIEKNFVLLGATAIEDKLQEGVPETIADLAAANIKIWVLTGDKQETAINIGYSCRLLNKHLELLICEETTKDGVKKWLQKEIENYGIAIFNPTKGRKKRVSADFKVSDPEGNTSKSLALIMSGSVLLHALEDECKQLFLDLSLVCKAVIACRVSPLQKSLLVQLVKQNVDGAITLAIGDGANDVSMIQAAHVGVGISGQEGLQAASASDYAIAQFRFLRKLLFVHGAFSYQRLSKLILYSFYKNICLYVIELWFAIYNGFSGQILFDKWCIGLYNVIFTMLPPLAFGLFDRTCSIEARLKCPRLYKNSQQSDLFNVKVFWIWIFTAIYHSILLFYLPKLIFSHDIAFSEGLVVGQWFVGDVVYTCVVITVCLKAALELDLWTIYSHFAIWGSIISWFIFLVIYCLPSLALRIAPNMIGQDSMLYSCALFWFTLIIIPVITLMVDFVYHGVQRTFKKNTRQTIQEIELNGGEIADWVIGEDGIPKSKTTVDSPTELQPETRPTGFAFSQEEGGAVSQSTYIRCYDTTLQKPGGN